MGRRVGQASYVPTINQTRLDAYLAAERKILQGQSVRFGDRELRRADLAEIRKEIGLLQAVVSRDLTGRGGRFSQADFGGVT